MKKRTNLILRFIPGQSFTIGDDIEITVLEKHGQSTVLSILAPKEICIMRANAKKKELQLDVND